MRPRWAQHPPRKAAAVLIAVSLALANHLCPLSYGVSRAVVAFGAESIQPSSVDNLHAGTGEGCAESCAYTRNGAALPRDASLTGPPMPLPLAVVLSVVFAFSLHPIVLGRLPAFPRLPGFPPILEFYRLRI